MHRTAWSLAALALAMLLGTAAAWARPAFEARQEKMLANITARMEALKDNPAAQDFLESKKACVEQARDHKALDECRAKYPRSMIPGTRE